jgi:hypothetical protein
MIIKFEVANLWTAALNAASGEVGLNVSGTRFFTKIA